MDVIEQLLLVTIGCSALLTCNYETEFLMCFDAVKLVVLLEQVRLDLHRSGIYRGPLAWFQSPCPCCS